MQYFKKDKLTVEIYENRTLMGEAAARDIKAKIAELLAEKQEINKSFLMISAAHLKLCPEQSV